MILMMLLSHSYDTIGLSRMRGCFSSTNTRHSLASACPRPTYGDSGWRVFGADMNITEGDKKRFWNKVDKSGGCWEWTAGVVSRGYGRFRLGYKTVYAHRFAYSLMHGSIPDNMQICHHCDNPRCVKPSHLFLGTQSDNIQDSVTKGRWPNRQGEKHNMVKLCEKDVHEIRRLYSLGVKQTLLAKMWRISQPHASDIVYRERWKHM